MYDVCDCCWETLAHDHHMLSIATYKDSKITIPLCANCHYMFHLIEVTHRHGELWADRPKTKAGKMVLAYRSENPIKLQRFRYLVNLLNFSANLTIQFNAMYQEVSQSLELEYLKYLERIGWCLIPPKNRVTEQWAELEVDGDKVGTEFLELLKRLTEDNPPIDQIRNEAIILLKRLSDLSW